MTSNASLLSTEVPGLDTVLGGGLSRGALIFLVGTSGAGKTVLGSQILFNAAQRGVSTLILTAFSESHVKLLEHLEPFAFFDRELVGSSVTLLSMQTLVGDEFDPVAMIIRTIRETGARLVMLDGFQGLDAMLRDRSAVHRLVASLASQLPYLDVTLIVTLEGAAHDPAVALELTAADVVIEMEYSVYGWRHRRRLQVVKQRGRGPLGGFHTYDIAPGGITVFPRLEALTRQEVEQPTSGESSPVEPARLQFGLLELDALLGGGLTPNTTTLLAGAPGVGKTTLALHWALANARPDATTVFLSFRERPERLDQKAGAFGLELRSSIESGALDLIWMPAIELNPDLVAARLLEAIAGNTTKRVVVDDIRSLVVELGDRARDYLGALVERLRGAEVTTLFLLEIPPLDGFRLDLSNTPISLAAENVVIVQQQRVEDTLHRVLAVLKMRFSAFDQTLRELVLDDNGVRVLTPEESAPGVLRGAAADGGGIAPARQP